MKPAYYNERNKFAAQWLRNLIAAGEIAPGDVDDRSITEVQPDDLRGYGQCHFFAGIGGWSAALRLAGWPDDRPVWTGSCPCQPFSAAGHQRGSDDERHLWPAFFRLIRERRPAKVFGEQVAGAAGLAWWDHVAADLEGEDYAAAAADLPASCVGGSHARARIYWVAADTAGKHGDAHGVLEQGGEWRPQIATRRLPSLTVRGGWWESDGGGERRPTLVRNHDGLSAILAGFGNAIVPELAARFVMANVAGKRLAARASPLDWRVGRLVEKREGAGMHTASMADSQGEFAEFKVQPDVPCRKCGVHAVSMREWESSCGGWEDYQYRCNACGHTWWVEGIDS